MYKNSPIKKTPPTPPVKIVKDDDLKPGNWYTDQLLPSGWKYSFKVTEDLKRRNGYKRLFKYRSESGQLFKSSWQAMQYLRTLSNKYSKTDVDNLLLFFRYNKNKETLKETTKEKEKVAESSKSNEVQNEIVIDDEEQNDKKEEEDVLEKLAELKQAVAEQTESLKVIETTDYNMEDVDTESKKNSKNPGKFGPSPYLPEGWLVAEYKLTKGGTQLRFKNPQGETFDSRIKL